jgi:hypothetical protein
MFRFNLFFLEKSEDRWIFETKIRRDALEPGPKASIIGFALAGLALIGLSLAGLLFGVRLPGQPHSGPVPFILFGFCGAIWLISMISAWRRSHWPLKAVFDLNQRRVTLTIKRPWSEVSQTYSFAGIRSLYAAPRKIRGIFLRIDFWEGYLESAHLPRLGRAKPLPAH